MLIIQALMSEKIAVRFLGVAGEIFVFSGAACSRVNLPIMAPNMSTLCFDTTGSATCCPNLSQLLN